MPNRTRTEDKKGRGRTGRGQDRAEDFFMLFDTASWCVILWDTCCCVILWNTCCCMILWGTRCCIILPSTLYNSAACLYRFFLHEAWVPRFQVYFPWTKKTVFYCRQTWKKTCSNEGKHDTTTYCVLSILITLLSQPWRFPLDFKLQKANIAVTLFFG